MRHLTALFAVLLLPAAALAGGYAVPNTNPRDQAMGGATTAVAEGAEAVNGNMAAVAGRDGFAASLSGTAISVRAEWTDEAATPSSVSCQTTCTTVPKAAFPINLNLAYGGKLPNGMGWGAGFAVSVPGGGLVHWPRNWAGRTAIQTVDRKVLTYELGVAFQPIEQLKIGVTGALFQGSEQLFQVLNFLGTEGEAKLSTNGTGLSYTAAIDVKPLKDVPFKFGVQYRHQAVMKLEGDAHFQGVPDAFKASGLIDQPAKHKLTFPNVLHVAVGYDPMADLTVVAAYEFVRWSVYKQDVFEGSKGTTIVVDHNYNDGWLWRLGAEYRGLAKGLKVRAGFYRDNSPQPAETISPALPESSKWVFQLGAGYEVVQGVQVNATWEHAAYESITAKGNETFRGTYATQADLFTVGVSYQMK